MTDNAGHNMPLQGVKSWEMIDTKHEAPASESEMSQTATNADVEIQSDMSSLSGSTESNVSSAPHCSDAHQTEFVHEELQAEIREEQENFHAGDLLSAPVEASEQEADAEASEQEADAEASEQEADDEASEQDADAEASGHDADAEASEQDADDVNPFDIDVPESARWYIVHTYSGFELRVEQTINEMIRTGQAQGLIYQVVVPTERVEELGKGGEKRTAKRKFYPGYIMVQMTMTDYSWHVVQTIPKVTGFVGGKNRPTPMRDSEADKILQLMRERQEKPRPKFSFERGDDVRVVDGPFGGFNGVVDEVNYDKGKLKVSVSIFGRQTPVELDFVQVSKG